MSKQRQQIDCAGHALLDVLRRLGCVGVEVADDLGDVGPIFDADAARLAVRCEADQQAPRRRRRRPPADDWLRQ